ncbi:MAG: cell division protein ZapA [Oleibacter sp.]|nr:cell division protein ZapA [Thalassolituus sp.]
MANGSKTLGLMIMDREYRVNCPAGAEEELRTAARHLNDKMEEIREASSHAGKVLGTDRIAVIAALNITHQLLSSTNHDNAMSANIERLNERLDGALDANSQLEL